MVGSDRGPRGHVALALQEARHEKARVVVLLVGRKDEIVEHLAAGYGRVVAEHGVDEPSPVFEGRIRAHHEAHRLAAVEHAASVADDAIDELDPLADLASLALAR